MDKLVVTSSTGIDVRAIQAWGKLWHFPYLSLSPVPIRHGRENWQAFLRVLTAEQYEALIAYITRWNTLAGDYVPDPLLDEDDQVPCVQIAQKEVMV